MSKGQEEKGLDRRGFLKAFGGGSAGAAVAMAVAGTTQAQAVESAADKKKKRYQETDHVKAFYRTNRY